MKGFSTNSMHNFKEQRNNKPHILPIYTGSSFVFDNLDDSIDVFTKKKPGHVYSRYGNPTIQTVEQQLAGLEVLGSDLSAMALMTSSGMSAIHVLLSALLKSGESMISQKQLYGGTTELFNKVMVGQGVETHYVSELCPDNLDQIYKTHPNIKALYLETPSNPTLNCINISECVSWAHSKGIYTVLDNTFCTSYIQQPLLLGIDFSIYSTTKYINGHGNSIAGAIIGKDEGLMKDVIWTQLKLSGGTCNPFDAWLTHNGLKTLELRMQRHSANALKLAQFLLDLPQVNLVNYPGLPSHSSHAVAKTQMNNGFGGMLSFEVKGGTDAVRKIVKQLKIATYAPTLGDVDTLIMHPATSSHLNISKDDQLAEGVTEGLIRVSVGIENIEDLISDFGQAIQS